MSLFWAIIFGIIQGAAEFLPISSSGHLALMHNLPFVPQLEEALTFDILLHLGTLIAVFAVYWRDIFALIPAFFTMLGKVFKGKFKLSEYTKNERFVIMLLIATAMLIPIVFVKDYIDLLGNYTKIVGALLILNGIVLQLSDRLPKGKTEVGTAKPKQALVVGLFQMCATVPGISRSGSTITGGLLMGLTREDAVKFSFILSIPAIIGANITSIPDLIAGKSGGGAEVAEPITSALIAGAGGTAEAVGLLSSVGQTPIAEYAIANLWTVPAPVAYIAGMVTAALVGLCAMKLLQYIAKHNNFRIFSYYCFALGLAALIFG